MDNFPSVVSTNDLFRLTIASAIFLATFSALIIFSSLRGVSFCCDPSLVNALKRMLDAVNPGKLLKHEGPVSSFQYELL